MMNHLQPPNPLNRILARISIESSSFFKEMLYLVLFIQASVWLFVLLQIMGISRVFIQIIGLFLTIVSFILYEIYRAKRKRLKPIWMPEIDTSEVQRRPFWHQRDTTFQNKK